MATSATTGALALEINKRHAEESRPHLVKAIELPTPLTQPVTPIPTSTELPSVETLQQLVVDALSSAKSQQSSADALSDATWTISNGILRIQTAVSKTMLGIVLNAEADKILRATLRANGVAELRLQVEPGVASAAPPKPKKVPTGSVQGKAIDHPLVQQAQKLFNAEIRNVIDLRPKE